MNHTSYGPFMYADDLILLSPSVSELQFMVKLCCEELKAINLKLNTTKSYCIRKGKRCFVDCSKIHTSNGDIEWAKKVKYLGLTITCNKRFKISFLDAKCKFYSAFNAIFSKLGHIPDPSVTIHLLESIAVPILMYGLESLNLNKSELNSLEFTFNRALYKIFKVSQQDNLKLCMHVYNIRNICERYNVGKNRFIAKLSTLNNLCLKNIMFR
jgi:hypothetical protein